MSDDEEKAVAKIQREMEMRWGSANGIREQIEEVDRRRRNYEYERMFDALGPGTALGMGMGAANAASGSFVGAINSLQGQLGNQNFQQMPKEKNPEPIPFDTPYWRNQEPVPADWRGAEITETIRAFLPADTYIFNFKSKWSGENIFLRIDAQKHSGEEADKIAATFREALNQRRLG